MKFVGLISGGKDSIFSILKLMEQGHELICVANLQPEIKNQELNSYMYQSVGTESVTYTAQALQKPLIQHTIKGKPILQDMEYKPTNNDEVEDLYLLLKKVKEQYPEIKGVSSGAIKSTYQKNRVENICKRLDLISLAPIWDREAEELLKEMVDKQMDAMLVRVCSEDFKTCLGKSILDINQKLINLYQKGLAHCCGEGGEFESFVLDCPIFKKKIVVEEQEIVVEDDRPMCYVARVNFKKLKLVDKQIKIQKSNKSSGSLEDNSSIGPKSIFISFISQVVQCIVCSYYYFEFFLCLCFIKNFSSDFVIYTGYQVIFYQVFFVFQIISSIFQSKFLIVLNSFFYSYSVLIQLGQLSGQQSFNIKENLLRNQSNSYLTQIGSGYFYVKTKSK